MTRRLVFAILTVLFLATTAATTAAQEEKKVGLGFIVGEPTGIDLKMWIGGDNALEFGLAWSLSDDEDLHIQGDYLWHRFDLIDLDNSDQLPLFFGIGGRIILRDEGDDIVGIRFPVGLDYIFTNYPFDIFVEIVPILDLAPDTDFDLEGAIGARFWF
jgi:hypothetical protein